MMAGYDEKPDINGSLLNAIPGGIAVFSSDGAGNHAQQLYCQ